MLAEIKQQNNKTVVELNRDFPYPIETVWQMLTDNAYLAKWFNELRIESLSEGGKIVFDLGNGHFEEMTITQVKVPTILTFTWDKELVSFQLNETAESSTHLVFKEFIDTVTAHTPRDIAGWHVCLDVIRALLDGQTDVTNEKKQWESLYLKYKELFQIQ